MSESEKRAKRQIARTHAVEEIRRGGHVDLWVVEFDGRKCAVFTLQELAVLMLDDFSGLVSGESFTVTRQRFSVQDALDLPEFSGW